MKTINKSELILNMKRILAKQFASSVEIRKKLHKAGIQYNNKDFYPALSQLILKDQICYNWQSLDNGNLIKYYHLTKKGKQFLPNTKTKELIEHSA